MKKAEIMQIKRKTVGRNDLGAMAVGQSVEFFVEPEKLESSWAAIAQQRAKGRQFKRKTNMGSSSIVVTRVK